MCPKDVDGIANSVDPDQTAPLGAVWSGSKLFATYLSENLGTIWYIHNIYIFIIFKIEFSIIISILFSKA